MTTQVNGVTDIEVVIQNIAIWDSATASYREVRAIVTLRCEAAVDNKELTGFPGDTIIFSKYFTTKGI